MPAKTPGVQVNKVNPKKLLNSKWTAVAPRNKEKHFLVTDIEFGEQGLVLSFEIEAVMTNRTLPIEWQELRDTTQWLQGWQ
jgi:tryptophan-rich hypothetical protein